MQIVIDISKDVYEEIMAHNRERRESGKSAYYFEGLIQNGTPLPKGHGDLIDRNSILCDDCICPCGHADECFKLLAPTIIEADKAESKEISDRNLKMWKDIYAEEKRRERSE